MGLFHTFVERIIHKIQSAQRVRVELFPAILNLPMVGLFYYLILSNQANWAIINGAAEGIFHLGPINYMILLLILLGTFACYCIIYFLLGSAKLKWAHNPILNILPNIFLILMVTVFIIVFNYNARLDYSFLYFFLGIQNGLILYLSLTLSVLALIIILVFQIPVLWRFKLSSEESAQIKIHPRLTTVNIILAFALVVPVMMLFVFYCPPTKIYWDNIFVIIDRLFNWFSLFTIGWILCVIIFGFFMGFQGKIKKKMQEKTYKGILFSALLGQCLFLILSSIIVEWEIRPNSTLSGIGFYSNIWLASITYIEILTILIRPIRNWVSNLSNVQEFKKVELIKVVLLVFFIFPPFWMMFYQPLTVTAPNADVLSPTHMQSVNGIEFPFQGSTVYPSFELQPPSSHLYFNLSGTWKFKFMSAPSLDSLAPRNAKFMARIGTGEEAPSFDDSSWQDIPVPQSYVNREDNPKTYGVVWYRKSFSIPTTFADKNLILKFISVNYLCDVWLDGQYLGYHEGSHYPFAFDITEMISTGDHVLAVRVDNPINDPRFAKRIVPEGGDFFNFAGIVREVYIEAAPRAAINRVDCNIRRLETTNYQNGSIDAEVNIAIRVPSQVPTTHAQIQLTIFPLNFSTPALLQSPNTWEAVDWSRPLASPLTQTVSLTPMDNTNYTAIHFRLNLTEVQFWSTKHPHLYAIIANLTPDGVENPSDIFCTQIGFRTIEVAGENLLLNKAPIKLAGMTYVEQHSAPIGISLNFQHYYEDMVLLNQTQTNFIRAGAHHPQAYLLMDRFGLTVWEDSPFGWFNDVNFYMAFSRNIINSIWIEIMFRITNRACVIYYGMCNEPWSTIGLFQYLPQVRDFLMKYDPGRIPSFTAASSQDWNPAYNYLQSVTPNTYGGTFEGERYAWDIEIAKSVQRWGDRNPGKPIVVIEWGYWREGGTDARQVECFTEGLNAFLTNPRVQGFVWFAGMDYYTMTYYNGMGIWDTDRVLQAPNLLPIIQSNYVNITRNNL